MVHHALYYKQNYSYSGVIEMLSGAPFDVKFISFEDIKNDTKLLETVDVIINVGDADTAHTGGIWWEDPEISSAIRRFVWNGGGFIGVGEPSGHPYQGHILQMASVLGVEEENGFTLNYDKYNWEEYPNHRMLTNPSTSVRERRIFMPWKAWKCWCNVIRKCRWRRMISARDVPYTSAVYRIVLPTAAPFTEPFCGVPTARMNCTLGSVPTTMWKSMLMSKMASIAL